MDLLTYNQIKKKVGEAWALIYNPIFSDKTGKLLKGELKSFDKSDKNLLGIVSRDKNPKKVFAILWFGDELDDNLLLNYF